MELFKWKETPRPTKTMGSLINKNPKVNVHSNYSRGTKTDKGCPGEEITVLIKEKRITHIPYMSQSELANKTGISRSYLSDLESGRFKNPAVSILCKLAKALDCRLDDLVRYKGEVTNVINEK